MAVQAVIPLTPPATAVAAAGGRTAPTAVRPASRLRAGPPAGGGATTVRDALTDPEADRLTRALVRGDRSALAGLYDRHFDAMIALLRRTTRRDESFLLDCVQDAWLRVAKSPARCTSAAALEAWLRRVALSAALDRLRSEAARRLREAESARRRRSDGAAPALAESLASIDAVRKALDRAMGSASPEERGLLFMRYRAGMTLGQIGAACGLGAAAIDSRLRRLLRTMKPARDDGEEAT